MLHALPAPVRGATHIDIEEASFSVRGFGHLRGTMGTATAEGTALDPNFPQWPAAVAIQDDVYREYAARQPNAVLTALADLAEFTTSRGLWG
jgi:hypothetical protein